MTCDVMLYDISNYLYSSFFVAQNDPNQRTTEDKNAYWKYLLMSMILGVKNKYRPKEVILCVDSKNTWRKDEFKYYKARRVLKKEKDTTDWDSFYKTADSFLSEIEKYFPFKVIKVDKAEADDIIAVLVEHLVGKKIIIVSRDKDFCQLLRYDNVKIHNPIDGEIVACEMNPGSFLSLHLLKGDSGDDVPNLLSDDNVFVNSDKRQKRITQKLIEEVLENGIEKFAIKNQLIENYERNRKLITLSSEFIPEEIVIDTKYKYDTTKSKGDFETMLAYLTKNNMPSLIDQL